MKEETKWNELVAVVRQIAMVAGKGEHVGDDLMREWGDRIAPNDPPAPAPLTYVNYSQGIAGFELWTLYHSIGCMGDLEYRLALAVSLNMWLKLYAKGEQVMTTTASGDSK